MRAPWRALGLAFFCIKWITYIAFARQFNVVALSLSAPQVVFLLSIRPSPNGLYRNNHSQIRVPTLSGTRGQGVTMSRSRPQGRTIVRHTMLYAQLSSKLMEVLMTMPVAVSNEYRRSQGKKFVLSQLIITSCRPVQCNSIQWLYFRKRGT